MKKTYTKFDEIICILDASGSMEFQKESIISGFNKFIKNQQELNRKNKVLVTLVTFNTLCNRLPSPHIQCFNDFTQCNNNLFNPNFSMQTQNNFKTIYKQTNIKDVELLNNKNYHCDGSTPLYDAIGTCLTNINEKHIPHSRTVVIITDGEENASTFWTNTSVKQLIKQKKESGWNFIFIGADPSCFKDSANIGLSDCSFKIEPSSTGFLNAWEGVNNICTFAVNSTSGKLTDAQFECALQGLDIKKVN